MAYGEYSGPDKADKGKEGGSCNRTLCQCSPANWYNHGSYAWYCDDCAFAIGHDPMNFAHWLRDFEPTCGHPQFETRAEMDARQTPRPAPRELGRAALEGFWSGDPEAAAVNQWYSLPNNLKTMWANAAAAVLAAAPEGHVEMADGILEVLRQHDRCPPEARDADRRAKTASLILQLMQPSTPARVEANLRYEYDPIAGKMRYFGSSAPNGWQGDKDPSPAPISRGSQDVLAERRRQVDVEDFRIDEDDHYTSGEMAWAATCYLQNAAIAAKMQGLGLLTATQCDERGKSLPKPEAWPWDAEWWKPSGQRRDLVKAAALIIAEIERIDRAAAILEMSHEK